MVELVEGEKVFDFYFGVGMFGIYFVKRGFKVEGIEINLFVVEMVKKNV